MEKTLHTKIMVGKKDGYRYWFAEAEQQGFAEIPTGVFDIVITGFGGRIYYHMSHPNKNGNINNDDYIPDGGTGFGLYGNAKIMTKASNGAVLWGTLATEITTLSAFGLLLIEQRGDVYILSSGVNQDDAKINAVADFKTHFTSPRYLEGTVYVNGNLYDLLQVDGTASVLFSTDEWYIKVGEKNAQVNLYVYPVGKALGAYFGIHMNSKGTTTLSGGFSGDIYKIKKSGCILCGCIGAWVHLKGGADASVTLPNLQLWGAAHLGGSTGIYADFCGIGGSASISADLNAEFEFPSPFCIAGEATIHTPSPFPNWHPKLRWKNGGFDFHAHCNE